jgi:hypothetical protein
MSSGWRVSYIVIGKWRHDSQPMLPCLKHCPIHTCKSCFVVCPQSWHQAQRITDTDSKSLAPDEMSTHHYQGSHDLGRSTWCGVTCIQRRIIWFAFSSPSHFMELVGGFVRRSRNKEAETRFGKPNTAEIEKRDKERGWIRRHWPH